ncbi:putative versatile peroxidase [Mycena albidolilacea]|uniref:Peroxidase n=1 Tax=Mycena albidolilacea TaxID=1033008 RepID=A0AAD6ZDD3_9AGAR|nr:putative versatile peroxidase [Mycena albidolilacea]
MKFSTLSILSLVYATTVLATPSFPSFPQRATCSNGRTASSATCCVWYNVLDDLQANVFDHRCEEDAHDALRLSFHDAISYSPNLQRQGKFGGNGADGSVIKFFDIEMQDPANEGLETIVTAEKELADKYGVSYGDIIQFAGAVSVRNCLFGPRIAFMAGRPAATQAAPPGLIPAPFDNVTTMLARVGDAGLTPEELIDLLASHSVASQKIIDETIPHTPFDLTPEIFDNNFYREVLLTGLFTPGSTLHTGEVKSPFPNEFRLQSDFALARDVRTKSHWVSLSLNQLLMQSRFATAMAKMALIGQNSGILHDCSEVIP